MELIAYTLEELESHLLPLFESNEGISPVSPLRLKSYLANPRASSKDPVLFEAWHENRLVAYRTLLPDLFYEKNDSPVRFAWLSGNYVIPEYRRQRLSTRLLELAEDAWEGKLMYTNYAPASKAVYDRTGNFSSLTRREGKRLYLRMANRELLAGRIRYSGLLKFTDSLVNRVREGRLRRFEPVLQGDCSIDPVDPTGTEFSDLTGEIAPGSLFKRDTSEFRWILNYPWVTEESDRDLKYHFTYQVSKFQNILLKFCHSDGNSSGFLWMVIRDNHLITPYLIAGNPEIYLMMAQTLLHTMISADCAYATIRHPELLRALATYSNQFLMVRNMPQLYFVHQALEGLLPTDRKFHDGDGDVVFTA